MTRTSSTRGAVRSRRLRRGRGLIEALVALDDDPVLLCGCESGCPDCDLHE